MSRDVVDSYVVFEYSYEHDSLIQLSVPLDTLEKAETFTKGSKNKKLYIFKLIKRGNPDDN